MKKYLLKYLLALAAVLAIGTTTVQAQLTTVTRAFSDFEFTNGQELPSGDLDENISFSTAQGSGFLTPQYQTSSMALLLRDGNSLTLTPKNGTVIIDVTVPAYIDGAITYTVDGGAAQSLPSYTEISNIGARQSLVITNASDGNMRMQEISITYLEAGHLFSMINPEEIDIYGSPGNTDVKILSLAAFNLTPAAGNITLTLPADFEASVDAGAYSGSVSLPYTEGTLAKKSVNIRLKSGTPIGNYSGTLAIAGGGLSKQVPLNASVTPATTVTAQGTVVTVTNLIFGRLSTALQGQTGITELTVTGTVDASDFKTIQSFASTLQKLNLTGVSKIQAYSGTGGSSSNLTDYPAGWLPANALSGCTALTEIQLPVNVIDSIGNSAFGNVPAPSLTVPEGVKVLERSALQSKIGKVQLPASLKHIRSNAFMYAEELTEITFAAGSQLETIETSPFFRNNKLSKIELPASLKSIGTSAFENLPALTELTIPDGLESLSGYRTFFQGGQGGSAGTGAENLVVNLPQNPQFGITGAMTETFYKVKINPSTFAVPDGVTNITRAFTNTGLTSITFSTAGNLKKISGGFEGTELTDLTIPEGVTEIGEINIATLKTADLPFTLETFSALGYVFDPDYRQIGVFTDSKDLESITSRAFIPPAAVPGDFTNVDKTTCILYVPADAIEFYETEPGWSDFSNIRAIVVKQAQSITWGEDVVEGVIAKTTADADFELSATATSGLAISYTITDGNGTVAELLSDGKTVTIKGAGTAKIKASQAGNDEWEAAEDVEITLNVTGEVGLWNTDGNTAFSLQSNPVDDEARFTFESAGSGASIVISDLSGKTVTVQTVASGSTEAVINVSNLSKGIYIARYADAVGKKATVKLVK